MTITTHPTTRRDFLKITAYATAAAGDILVFSPEPDDPQGRFIAQWREDWPGDDGSELGYGSTHERAAIDLMTRFPREG